MMIYTPLKTLDECVDILRISERFHVLRDIITLLDIINEPEETPWSGHPAVRQWRGHEVQLIIYGEKIIARTNDGGVHFSKLYRTDMTRRLRWHMEAATSGEYSLELPKWWGNAALHDGHAAELIRLDPTHYWQLFPHLPSDLPVFWGIS